jgi:acetyltransferase-like isoleucine patch superfamily enzyme
MRQLLALVMVVLPQRLKRLVANRLLGWEIHPTARIGMSYVAARKVVMAEHSFIGPFNLIRDLDELRMERSANIASRNWIKGVPAASLFFGPKVVRDPSLVMREFSLIAVSHHIDCADRVELGRHSAIAGFNSVILTHSLDFASDRFRCAPVVLGDHCALLTAVTVAMGMTIPDRAIVSAGSVVANPITAEQTFYRGNPAEAVRELPASLRYFRRTGLQAQVQEEIDRWSAGS